MKVRRALIVAAILALFYTSCATSTTTEATSTDKPTLLINGTEANPGTLIWISSQTVIDIQFSSEEQDFKIPEYYAIKLSQGGGSRSTRGKTEDLITDETGKVLTFQPSRWGKPDDDNFFWGYRGLTAIRVYLGDEEEDVRNIYSESAVPTAFGTAVIDPNGYYASFFEKQDIEFKKDSLFELITRPVEFSEIKDQFELALVRLTPDSLRSALSKGFDPNTPSLSNGPTPLMWVSCCSDSTEMVQILLDAGADLEGRMRKGLTPLMLVAKGWFGGVNFYTQNPEILRILLDAGAELEARDTGDGDTALAHAVGNANDLELVRMLIDAGADVNAKNRTYEYPVFLHAATSSREHATEVLQLLLDAGADPFVRDRSGNTALIESVYRGGTPDTVKMLLELGIDPTVKGAGNSDLDGNTALELLETRMKNRDRVRTQFEDSEAYTLLKDMTPHDNP